MRCPLMFTTAAVLFAASGCTYSVYPVLTDKDLTSDVDLTGTWTLAVDDPKSRETYTFSLTGYGDCSLYDASFLGREFLVELGRVGEQRYLQFEGSAITPEPPLLTALPVHGFVRFKLDGDTMIVHRIHDNAAIQLFKEKQIPFVEYAPSDMVRFYVLTLDTAKLQAFLKEHDKKLFKQKPITFKRSRRNEMPWKVDSDL